MFPVVYLYFFTQGKHISQETRALICVQCVLPGRHVVLSAATILRSNETEAIYVGNTTRVYTVHTHTHTHTHTYIYIYIMYICTYLYCILYK